MRECGRRCLLPLVVVSDVVDQANFRQAWSSRVKGYYVVSQPRAKGCMYVDYNVVLGYYVGLHTP